MDLVLKSGERIQIHKNLLALQSKQLELKIPKMLEPSSLDPFTLQQINLFDWEKETVERFVEYAYTGDYHCPDPVPLTTPTTTPERESVPEDKGGPQPEVKMSGIPPSPGQAQEGVEQELSLEQPLTPLQLCFPAGPDPPRTLSAAERFTAKYFDPTEHDFEEVFLAHAKIYTLALQLEIDTLCTLALQRLLRTLVNINPVDLTVARNFVELARYTYSSTNSIDDPLRRIISQFAALNFTSLQAKEMDELVRGEREFAVDLMRKASRRLIAADKDADKVKLEAHIKLKAMEDEFQKARVDLSYT